MATSFPFACSQDGNYVFVVRPYDEQGDCVGPEFVAEVFAGPEPGSACDPVCLVGNGATFVTETCGPSPPLMTVVYSSTPACGQALAADKQRRFCTDGGRVDATAPPQDSSAWIDSAPEAGEQPIQDGAQDDASHR